MPTHTLKLYLGHPLPLLDRKGNKVEPSPTWDDLGPCLRDVREKVAKAMNNGMTKWYLWQVEAEEIKQATGEYPSKEERPDPTNDIYHENRVKFPEVASRLMSSVARECKSRWNTDRVDVFKLNKSLSTFRKTFPIPVDNQAYSIRNFPEGLCLSVTLMSQKHKGFRNFRISIREKMISKGPRKPKILLGNSQKAILQRIMSGEYKRGMCKLAEDKRGKWYANISYEFEAVKDKSVVPDRIVGVDLGIQNAFYCALSDGYDRLSPGDSLAVFNFRQQIKKRRQSIQRGYRTLDLRKGKGRVHALKPLDKLSEKEANFRDCTYHNYSKAIVEFAVKHKAGIIQMENLDGLKAHLQDNCFLKGWAISDLHSKIKYKAEANGIEVRFVNPAYTSQRCHKCGCIDSQNRRSQSEFVCVQCFSELNADFNAAKNLAVDGIDLIIDDALKQEAVNL